MDYLLVAIVLLLLPFAFARPFFGAIVYTTLAFLRPQNLTGGIAMSMRLSLLVLAATCAGLAVAYVRGKERPEWRTPWFALSIALAGTLWIATRTAVFPALAFDAWTDFLKMLTGVAVTVALCTTPERIRAIVITAALALGAQTLISLANPVFDAGRLSGAGGGYRDSNDFALALTMLLPILLCGWRLAEKTWIRVAMLGLVPFVLVAIVLTQSRGGFLALAAVLGAWALFTRGRVFKLALAPAAILAFLALAPASYLERLTTIQKYSHDSSARDRLSSWNVAWKIAEDRPLTGVGPGNFLAVYDRYKNDFRRPHVAHNTPLQILANAGIPALAAFMMILFYGAFTAARVARRARLRRRAVGGRTGASFEWIDAAGTGIALALLAFAVGSQFLSRDEMDFFYLLTGLAGALVLQARRQLAATKASSPVPARSVIRGRVVAEVPCVSVH